MANHIPDEYGNFACEHCGKKFAGIGKVCNHEAYECKKKPRKQSGSRPANIHAQVENYYRQTFGGEYRGI